MFSKNKLAKSILIRNVNNIAGLGSLSSGLEHFGVAKIGFLALLDKTRKCKIKHRVPIQGDQDHFLAKEMLISLSILKLHKNP